MDATRDKKTELTKLFLEVKSTFKNCMTRNFAAMGLTLPQLMLIGTIHENGKKPMRMSDLSEQLNMTNSTVSGIVDRLEAQGAVERIRNDKDRREVYIGLSKDFRDRHADFHTTADDRVRKMLDGVSETDLDKILEGLATLKNVLARNESNIRQEMK